MKGWLKVPGIRPEGDRTLEEQMLGLERALTECKGKRVLDLGCAEGLIGREFAKAGAEIVVGVESLQGHIDVALQACAEYVASGKMKFKVTYLQDWVATHPAPVQYDIVLALGIIHKMEDPAKIMEWTADAAKDLLCFRAPAWADSLPNGDYLIRSKHFPRNAVNVPELMRSKGFVDEGTFHGVRGESVQYWRRK